MKRRGWSHTETKVLIDSYDQCTIKELELMFPERSRESINNKIKRLKAAGKIAEGRDDITIKRAYEQRGNVPLTSIEDLN